MSLRDDVLHFENLTIAWQSGWSVASRKATLTCVFLDRYGQQLMGNPASLQHIHIDASTTEAHSTKSTIAQFDAITGTAEFKPNHIYDDHM